MTWTANDNNPLPANPINITYGSGTVWSTITTDETNDGSYDWDTTSVPCPGTFWMNLSVIDSKGQKTFDESNYSFDFFCPVIDNSPLIAIFEPGGTLGQAYNQGDVITVTWTANDDNPLPANPINITYGDSISGWTTIASNEENDGTYSWDTSNAPCPGDYWIKLSVFDSIGQTAFAESSYSFDLLCADMVPPTIANLFPQNSSIINYNTPTISANYSDLSSGIDLSSVLFRIDDIDQRSNSDVSLNGITYIPLVPLEEDLHTIYLEVRDIRGNLAKAHWSFSIDITPPSMKSVHLKPPDQSTINYNKPTIIAGYGDKYGIDINSVSLTLDGVDITSLALVATYFVSFKPISELSEGIHTVHIKVSDTNGNVAEKSWTFIIDAASEEKSQVLEWWPIVVVVTVALILIYPLARLAKLDSKNETRQRKKKKI